MAKMWYKSPASCWNEALPVGGGRIGAMVCGGTAHEELHLNEDSIWSGGPQDRVNPLARENVSRVRVLIREGRVGEAQRLAQRTMNATPVSERVYQTAGNLVLDFENIDDAEDYRRELDLERAVSRVSFSCGGTEFVRETFASYPAGVIVLHLAASARGAVSFTARLERGIYYDEMSSPDDSTIALERRGDVAFCAAARAVAEGGSVRSLNGVLHVSGADAVTVIVAIETAFRNNDPRSACQVRLDAAAKKTYAELLAEHTADYAALFGRLTLELCGDTKKDDLPTDERLRRFAAGESDNGLEALYYGFGRYLLISSSREGSLPANLQGIWNDHMDPPWGSKFTVNINTEMNYWPANMCALPETELPLFEHLERMLPNGRRVAREMYGAGGFVCHHNTDIWGDCAPQDDWLPATHWVLGAAWLSTHIREHYEYTLDRAFLERYYPVMREACEFFVDYLSEDESGRLTVSPTVSPENTYVSKTGEQGCLCDGCTMDNQILRRLFGGCIDAERVLGIADGLTEKLRAILPRLPETRIHSNGTIMEWNDEYEEVEPGHRHISHLYGLFPSDEITCEHTPELAQAARETLRRRLSAGGGHTGWSMAWIINMYARLHEGEKCAEGLRALLSRSTLPNLFDDHPPFQIDGNFGAVAGMTQMIIQSIGSDVILLPALPPEWHTGSLCGVRLRGALTADLRWANGKVTSLTILSKAEKEREIHVVNGKASFNVLIRPGENSVL